VRYNSASNVAPVHVFSDRLSFNVLFVASFEGATFSLSSPHVRSIVDVFLRMCYQRLTAVDVFPLDGKPLPLNFVLLQNDESFPLFAGGSSMTPA
jgi:hypothetical protein